MTEHDETGVGPNVKCGAVLKVPPPMSTRIVFGKQPCVRSPADGHTLHRTDGPLGSSIAWEGHENQDLFRWRDETE